MFIVYVTTLQILAVTGMRVESEEEFRKEYRSRYGNDYEPVAGFDTYYKACQFKRDLEATIYGWPAVGKTFNYWHGVPNNAV